MRITTAGESHGKGLFAILEGMPAGLKLDLEKIDLELARRQSGFGRGARQTIEQDKIELLSGVRNLVTMGSPIALAVWNRDYENWREYMAPEGCDTSSHRLTKVRPGHADLTGIKKFATDDARNVFERASARETAARVAAGAICRQLLEKLGIYVSGYVRSVGTVSDTTDYTFAQISVGRSQELGMINRETEMRAKRIIEETREHGDTLGGVMELRIGGLKSGFGSCMTYAEKLDSRLIAALMSIQAIKGVEVGIGFDAAERFGGEVHDEIFAEAGKIQRKTNRAGGIEGGMSNGEEIVLRAAMKPVSTLKRGLMTVDTETGEPSCSAFERSDVCAVTACEVILESVLCIELTRAVLERLGGDTMAEIIERYGRLPQ